MTYDWTPDWAALDAVESGRLTYRDLCPEDLAYVVAALTHRGHTPNMIAARLKCSGTHVRRIRRQLLTRVMVAYCRALDSQGAAAA